MNVRNSIPRRNLLALLGACLAAPVWAQGSFPDKPVKIIVPFPAGGLADTLARGIAQELGKEWKQSVVVENRPGANTIIGATATAKAPADGYTLLMANDPTMSSNQYLYSKLPYDPVKDLVPVLNVAESANLLVARSDLPASTVRELIAAAKARPGAITYGTFGPGSKPHIDTEALAQGAGVRFLHVPFKGIADVLPALLAKQIDIAFTGVPPALQLIKNGDIRPIAIASTRRSSLLPQVPTFEEAGVPNFVSSGWFGLVAPAGTPQNIISKVARDVLAISTTEEFKRRFVTGVGLEPLNQAPEQFAEFLVRDRRTYERRIKAVNVKLD